jgi:NADH:ubiquinone oxidoreductase subunit K
MLAIIILIGVGIYCLLARRNIIQLLIGIEIIAKGVTLSFILAGFFQGNEHIAQAIVVTIILIEAITAAVAMSLIVMAHRHTDSLDIKDLRRLRG